MANSIAGVLHTNSVYAQGINFNLSNFKTKSSGKLETLKAKEHSLYNKFGVNSYHEFLQEVRNLFQTQDIEVIQRFEAENLKKSLKNYAYSTHDIFEQQVQLVFDFSQIENLKNSESLDLKKSLRIKKGAIIDVSGPPILENLTYNATNLKQVFNKYFSYHHFQKNNPNWTANLENFVKDLVHSGILSFQTKQNGVFKQTNVISSIPNFPWGVKKKDVELAEKLGTDSAIYKELQRALTEIQNFIFNQLGAGATPELRTAMTKVWNKNFSQGKSNPLLFFSGGTEGNFISGVQGAMGEFQGAVIFEYLALKKGANAFAKIIGNAYERGEQLRTDVQIFETLGLQVKNVNEIINNGQNGLLRDLATTIHPYDLSEYFQKDQSFLDFLANYYFNSTYKSKVQSEFDQLEQELGNHLGEIMNMAMSDSISNKVTFYLISGKYLVPCSAILEQAEELKLQNNLTITSSYEGRSDMQFLEKTYQSKRTNRVNAAFAKYWRNAPHSEEKWQATQANKQEAKNLVQKRISIRTHFDLMKNIQDYALF